METKHKEIVFLDQRCFDLAHFLEMIINSQKRVWSKSAENISPFDLMSMYLKDDMQKSKEEDSKDKKDMKDIDQLVKVLDNENKDEL